MRKVRIMIQPEDNRTLPLPLPVVTEKRGRGRPRKEGALTNAQRQAAFRARRAVGGNPVIVTKKIPVVADGYDELVLENDRLREELAAARAESAGLKGDLAEARQTLRRPVGHKWSYRQLTDAVERHVRYRANGAKRDGELSSAYAFALGAVGVWNDVTMGWREDGEEDRLDALMRELFDVRVTRNEKSGA